MTTELTETKDTPEQLNALQTCQTILFNDLSTLFSHHNLEFLENPPTFPLCSSVCRVIHHLLDMVAVTCSEKLGKVIYTYCTYWFLGHNLHHFDTRNQTHAKFILTAQEKIIEIQQRDNIDLSCFMNSPKSEFLCLEQILKSSPILFDEYLTLKSSLDAMEVEQQ